MFVVDDWYDTEMCINFERKSEKVGIELIISRIQEELFLQ